MSFVKFNPVSCSMSNCSTLTAAQIAEKVQEALTRVVPMTTPAIQTAPALKTVWKIGAPSSTACSTKVSIPVPVQTKTPTSSDSPLKILYLGTQGAPQPSIVKRPRASTRLTEEQLALREQQTCERLHKEFLARNEKRLRNLRRAHWQTVRDAEPCTFTLWKYNPAHWRKPKYVRPVRAPRPAPRPDYRAEAKVIWSLLPPLPRSPYLLAKLQVKIESLAQQRVHLSSWERSLAQHSLIEKITQWGILCINTGKPHTFTGDGVRTCSSCGVVRRSTALMADHESGVVSKLSQWFKDRIGWDYNPDRKPWFNRAMYDESLTPTCDPCFGWCIPVKRKTEVRPLGPFRSTVLRMGDHEMDLQSDPVGEVGSEQVELGNVTLEQESTTPVVAVTGASVADIACATEVVDACPEIIERGLYLDTIVWNSSSGLDSQLASYNLISDIFKLLKSKKTPNLMMFEAYRYVKLDVELIFSANTTMFHTGMLQISATYLKQASLETSYYSSIYTLSQRHHVILNAGAGNEVSIIVPFDYYKTFLYMDTEDTEGGKDYATVLVKVLAPLRQASDTPTSVDIMVYAKLKKVNFTGMIPRSFKTFDHQMNIIGPAARVVSQLLADPNRDYPSVPGAVVRMQPQSSQALCYGTNCDLPITTLRLDPSVQTPHPQKLVDFNIHTVKRVWGLVTVLDGVLSTDSVIGTQLWSTEVSPILPKDSLKKLEDAIPFNPGNSTMVLATYAHPPVSVLASMYGYWSGSLEFKFQVVQTKFHSARLIVGFIPGKIPQKDGVPVTVTIDDLRNSLHTVYNIQDSNEFIFSVPYLSHTPVQPRRFVNGTFGSNFPSIGTLFVMVANRLALSENVPKTVSINVYMRGGPNLEFFHPVAPSLVPGTRRAVKVRGIQGKFKNKYFPVSIGTWREWTVGDSYLPIYRYGETSDHVSQFDCNVYGVYDISIQNKYTGVSKINLCQWLVPVRFGGYTYACPFPTEDLAKQYINKVSLVSFLKGDKQVQLTQYAALIDPKAKTDSELVEPQFKDTAFPVTYAIFDHEMSMRDEADAVVIENVTAAGPLGRTLFGEKLCDLKDLARRYQFVGSYRKRDRDVHDNPLYTDIIVPVCPNFVTASAPPYDRLGVHPTALLATGYRGFRGSLRYKLIYRGNDNATIYVQHRFDAKPRIVDQQQYVHGVDDLIATGYATLVQVTKVNPVVDFEVPYYSIYNYLITGSPKENPNEHEKTIKCNGNLLISVDSNSAWSIDVWSAFGDDASYHMFQGFPPMGYSSGLPIDLIPEHLPQLARVRRDTLDDEFVRIGDHEGLLDYVPGVSFARNASNAVNNVNDVATTLKSALNTASDMKQNVVNKSKDVFSFITSIPGLMLSLGEQVWQALLQMVQVYLNPTKKSLAVCIVSVLLGICSHFKNYADALFKLVLGLVQRKDALEIVGDMFDDSDSETDDPKSEFWKLRNLHGEDEMFSPPQRNKGEYIPKYDPKHSPYTRIGDHQMKSTDETSDWVSIASLLVAAISGACNKKVSVKEPKKLVSAAIASIPDQARSTTYIMRYLAIIISLVKVCTEYVKKTLWPQLTTLDVPDKSITAWYTLACELTDVTAYESLRSDQDKINQVYQEVKRGDSIVVIASASTEPKIRAVASTLRAKLTELRKVKQRLFEERICSTSYTTPFCIWMYGRPGIGKSVGGARIRADLMRAANIKAVGDISYTISPGKKHLDGLNTQPCVIFDDFGAIDDTATTPEVLQMYMEMISSEPYRPPMAALDEKKLVHNAELVYINSNFAYPRYPCVADSSAFYRRRHKLVYVKQVGDPLDLAKAKLRGPVTKENTPNLKVGALDHLEFTFLDPTDPSDLQQVQQTDFMSYAEFIEMLKQDFLKHRASAAAIAEERMESERDLRQTNEALNMSFAEIKNSITSCLFSTCSSRVEADHQMGDPIVEEQSTDDENSQTPLVHRPRRVRSWSCTKANSGESSNAARQESVMRQAGSSSMRSAPHQLLGDGALRAQVLVSDFDDGSNTPDTLAALAESDERVSDYNFALIQADHILRGERIDTSVCKHNLFTTACYYENGVFVGNNQAFGNEPCNPRKFPDCKWLDHTVYRADMMAWWCQHEEEMKTKINIIRTVNDREVTDDDVPPYFIDLFAQANKERILIAEAEQSWLKYIQYLITVRIPDVIAKILNFVGKHWLAIAVIAYVSFLFSMMGLACAAGIEDIKGQRLRNERFKNNPDAPPSSLETRWESHYSNIGVNAPTTPKPPLPPGMHHQIIPSGDNHSQRVGNARKITQQLRKGDHQIEMNQRNKDCLRLLSANTWFLCLLKEDDTIKCEARVIALRAQKILIIRHYVEGFQEAMRKDPTLRLILVRPSCILPCHTDAFDTVKYMRDDGTTAFGIMDGPSNMPLARDITRIIAPSGQHDSIDLEHAVLGEFNMGDHPAHLVPTIYPVSCFIDSVLARERDGMSAVMYHDAYFYPVSGRGMCGSVLICDGALVGVHVCGQDGYGAAEPICREWFSKQVAKEIIPLNPPEFLPIEKAQLLLTSSNLPLGVCDTQFAHHESGKTKIIPSKIHGVFKIHTEPAPLTRHDPRLEGEHKGKSPMREGCEKHGQLVKEFPRALLEAATEDLSAHLNAVVKPARGKVGVLSLEEAIMGFNGRAEYQKMEMNTSEGYPWVARRPPGARNKSWMFQFENDPNTGLERLTGVNEELLAVLSVNDALRKRNCRPHTVYTDCLKDARLPVEKCKRADKTRIFSISPVDHTIACRQYYMDFAASYQRARFENECGVGVVVQGREWTKLYKYLDSNSKYIVCGDYSNFGPGLQSGVVRAAFKIIADWYLHHGADETSTRVRNVLAEENINSIHLMLNTLYATCGGAPSGNPLTVVINSLVNCLYVRMAWKTITGLPMSDFYRYVRLVTYGDDLIMSVQECVIDKFNNQTLQNFFAQYDIKYTDIDKGDGTIRKHCTIEEASFLKRTFIPHPDRPGHFLACAEIASIEDCANWIRECPDKILATEINATTCCDVAYSRGKEYHNMVVNRIRKAWATHVLRHNKGYQPLKIRTWSELDALYFSDEWQGQPWTEHAKLMLSL